MIWEPAVYEHKAALIARSPAEVSRDPLLLGNAVLAEYETYAADYITVGIDVYNIEAEACGATLVDAGPRACPDIPVPPWSLQTPLADASQAQLPNLAESSRLGVLLDAAERARDQLATRGSKAPKLRIAASGPVSIAAKLVGTEELLIGAATEDPAAATLLEFATDLCESGSRLIRSRGFDVSIVDSSASPPLFSPELYRSQIFGFHARIMHLLDELGQSVRPLILGGDTTAIVSDLLATGANSVICDFSADAEAFAARIAAMRGSHVMVRRNVRPNDVNDRGKRGQLAAQTARELALLPGAILGTGILPYDQDPRTVLEFRDAVAAAAEV